MIADSHKLLEEVDTEKRTGPTDPYRASLARRTCDLCGALRAYHVARSHSPFTILFPYAIGIAILLPIAGVWLSRADARWLSVERMTTLVFSLVAEAVTLTTLFYLMLEMLDRPANFSGRQLLTSSIGTWVTNVLVFSLVYWQIDRGGPVARANDAGMKPDWLFPQTGVPEEAPPTGGRRTATTCSSLSRRRRRSAQPMLCR